MEDDDDGGWGNSGYSTGNTPWTGRDDLEEFNCGAVQVAPEDEATLALITEEVKKSLLWWVNSAPDFLPCLWLLESEVPQVAREIALRLYSLRAPCSPCTW